MFMSFIVPQSLPEPPPNYDYTQKELDFCIHYVYGLIPNNATESIKAAHYDVSNDNSAAVMGNDALSKPKVIDYISILKQHSLSHLVLTRDKKREILAEIAQEVHHTVGGHKTRAQNMTAIDLDNKMTGEYDLSLAEILGRIVYDVEFTTGDEPDDEPEQLKE